MTGHAGGGAHDRPEAMRISTGALLRAVPWAVSLLVLTACSGPGQAQSDDAVVITGSATIGPIAEIASRESGVATTLETVGSYEGFAALCSGEAHLANASAPMPGADGVPDYQQMCTDNGVEYVEVPIGIDAVSIIRNEVNASVDDITRDELTAIWDSGSSVRSWSDVRPGWSEEEIVLHGRDEGSGTHRVFVEEILGEGGELRRDVATTDDLDALARQVAEEPNALAFMGVGNYLSAPEADRNRITTVTVEGVAPDAVSSVDGAYPLARPLYVYVSLSALEDDPRVEEYVDHLLENGRAILPRAFFYPLDESGYAEARERLRDRVTGPAVP